jgi:uncharacterized membrane-anchored protein YitT (DUF2179 family)
MWFLEPAQLYSGGVTGISQLISNASEKWIGHRINLGFLTFVINIPIIIIGWKHVSKRFVICSLVSILLQTILMSGIIPYVDFIINTGKNPLTGNIVDGNGVEMDPLLLSFVGGFISGFGSALALRHGTSTGGIDILSQALSFKKNISIGYISMVVNVIIAILGAMLFGNAAIAFYTIVRIISSSVITDKLHTAYNYMKVEIITTKGEEIAQFLMYDIGRGITTYNAYGAFTHSEKKVLETVVSKYEINRVIDDARKIDPQVFVTVTPIKKVYGNFKKKTIA